MNYPTTRPRSALILPVLILIQLASHGQSVEYNFVEIDLPEVEDVSSISIWEINNQGTLIGEYFDFQDIISFVWSDGTYREPQLPEMNLFQLFSVNDVGDLTGTATDEDGPYVFTWDGETLRKLRSFSLSPGSSPVWANVGSFTDDDTILGTYSSFDPEESGIYQWSSEGVENVYGPTDLFIGVTRGNRTGTIVGETYANLTNVSTAFVIKEGVFEPFLHPYTHVQLMDINDSDVIIGNSFLEGEPHGFTYYDGVFTDVRFPDAEYTILSAINDHGWIAGTFKEPNSDQTKGFLAIPVPEPSGLLLAGAALLTVTMVNRKR